LSAMKHPLATTALLIFLFVCAQIVGISLLSMDINNVAVKDGITTVQHNPTIIGERPETSGGGSLLYILIGVAVGTALMLFIIKFKLFSFWKIWFFIAVWLSTAIALGVIIPAAIAFALCFVFALWKIYKPNPIVHNITEIFMYAGIALLIAPLFTLWWAVALLLIISVYDIIAVWHSKHMVTMAKAQTENKLFAGLYIPRADAQKEMPAPSAPSKTATTHTKIMSASTKKIIPEKSSTADDHSSPKSSGAILGGGDIAFPLIFSGVVMDWLITARGATQMGALYETLIITATTTIALALLFFYAKKDRYYPAMPFLSAGCFIGLGIIVLL
jgi:presenilin-like A22 family membrane protease